MREQEGVRFDEAMRRIQDRLGVSTQAGVAAKLGIKRAAVTAAKERGVIPGSWLLRLKADFGLSPRWVLTGEGAPLAQDNVVRTATPLAGHAVVRLAGAGTEAAVDFISLPYFDVEVDEEGSLAGLKRTMKAYLAFQAPWIHAKGSPARMGIYKVIRDNMHAVAPDGSVVLADESQNVFVNNKIFIVRHNGEIKLKRLRRSLDASGREVLELLSEDGVTPPEVLGPDDDLEILAKALWVGHPLD